MGPPLPRVLTQAGALGRAQLPLGLGGTKRGASSAPLGPGQCVLTSSPQRPTESCCPMHRIQATPSTGKAVGETCLSGNPPPYPLFNLRAASTKRWPQSGPTCRKRLPGNGRPHPPRSPQLQSGLPSSREGSQCFHPLQPPTPHLCRLQQHSRTRPGREMKQKETAHTPAHSSPSPLLSVILGMCFHYKYKKWVSAICPSPLTQGPLGLCRCKRTGFRTC